MTPEEFRAAGHDLIDWIADYRSGIPDRPVRSEVPPGWVHSALDGPPPETPEPLSALMRDLDEVVVPGITQTQSPGYYAWFPANASLESVLGDITASGLGALGITWQSAPALTEMEEVVTDWLRSLCGLSDAWHGSIHDTASTACLVAMLVARERATDMGEDRGGLQAEAQPLVVYASTQAHSSVAKAVLLAGYGRDNLRLVDVDPVPLAMDATA
ncbi:MAG: pyridoxal phosphate-dependent decarboxylase family protein, partial [Candidatus Nanopelagicales bacterium]